ncbi:MAG: hypothetical protein AAFZ04_14880 [Pseudomonadota bacterium]
MYITDPFQFSAAGYRFMGLMVEQQMRVMKVLGDAALASNPLLSAGVSKRATPTPTPVKATSAPKSATHASKPAMAAIPATPKRPRQPSAPPAMPKARPNGAGAHPAE